MNNQVVAATNIITSNQSFSQVNSFRAIEIFPCFES